MNGKIYLDTRKNQLRKNGFPVMVTLTNKGKRKEFTLKGFNYFEKDWDFEKNEPKKGKREILLLRQKKSILDSLLFEALTSNLVTLDYIKNTLKTGNKEPEQKRLDIFSFGESIISEMKKTIDEKGFEKKGNAKVYNTALNQLKIYDPRITFDQIDYTFLTNYKNWQLKNGKSKNTVHNYLRTLRAIYNEAVRRGLTEDKEPFNNIFKGITLKQNRTQKRYVSKKTIKILESLSSLAKGQQEAVDLYLLQFYLGGQDFKDICYLEHNQITEDRVYFTRGKLDGNGYQFDLKLFPKAYSIIEKYKTPSTERFLFPWRKDADGYKTFIRRVQRNLVLVQNGYNKHIEALRRETGVEFEQIKVLPLGGNLSPKTTRHTFATLGSRLYIEPDLLRSLMGHDRNDVDTIYKDTYPEEERDKFHFKIIDTNSIKIEQRYVYSAKERDMAINTWVTKHYYYDELSHKQIQHKIEIRKLKSYNNVEKLPIID